MREGLRDAIDEVYRAFSAYSRPESFLGCGCCFEDETLVAETGWNDTDRPIVRIAAPGGAAPLQDVTADELEYIVADLILTCGDVGVLKHYLARLLELIATPDPEWDVDPELVIGKLSLGPDLNSTPWWEWADHERAAVRRFLWEYWLDRFDATTDGNAVDEALCAIGQAEPDLTVYLEALLDVPTRRLHVARLAEIHAGDQEFRNAWWDCRYPASAAVASLERWLATPAAQAARGGEGNQSRANGGD